ncbi:uncharacterized protein B0I36DRAFT_367597 [Microdochium trichocladiopsis]|uniref:BZIP domain-containing protein n=1 Tax=Microdochium trichocladiopsis TaxID=1682393 RepID=A0A9P9BI29_9PEZI|nr:uncharacterized protein B0I36DRAFT_367597 [Microdochium trichocladiopsis]KAH7021160.1 hypothetical protein B0I36DRAFT_367597 [Microdochium trichocladiopsis]
MSSFTTGRRGQSVNMSQYLQTLNEIRQEPSPEDTTGTLEDDLAVFANTNFVDWDTPTAAHHTSPVSAPTPSTAAPSVPANTPMMKQAATPAPPNTDPLADLTTFDFNLDGYGFDFNPYTSSGVPAFSENLSALQPLQPAPTYASHGSQRNQFVPAGPPAGEKRKADTVPAPRQLSFEDQSRLAAEEDKRRRNTAASARFRVKKKAREQALEKSQKEYADKIVLLEGRISTLETENKWLRELVMEKNGGSAEAVSTLMDGQKAKESSKNDTASKSS